MNWNRFLLAGFWTLVFQNWGISPLSGRELASTLVVHRVNHRPKIDGKLDDVAWKSASRAELAWTVTDEKARGAIQTYVLAVYDDANLYLAFLNRDSHVKNLQSNVSEHDQNVLGDDCVVVSLEPENTGKGAIFNIAVNPANVTRDAWIPPRELSEKARKGEIPSELVPIAMAYPRELDWEPRRLKTATHIDGTFWAVEMKISFEDLLQSDAPTGQVWRGNLMRHAVGWGDVWTTWTKAGGNFIAASEKFGDLVFEK